MAFQDCSGLKKINFEDSVTEIDYYAFGNCTSLEEVSLPDSITVISSYLFQGCSGLRKVVIPASVTRIEDSAFQACRALTRVTLPENVTYLGYGVFWGCDNLVRVEVPKNVTEIGGWDTFPNNGRLILYGIAGSSVEEFAGEHDIKFVDPSKMKYASVTGLSAKSYSGKAITQEPVVMMGDRKLVKGTDYTIAFKDNTNAGKATITITGKGNISGNKTAAFTINKVSVSSCSVSGMAARTYTGKALTQTPVVKIGSATLKANTDYTVAYKNNTNAGTATVTITGKGNYTGTKTATFKISKAAQSITVKSTASSIAAGKTATVSIAGNKGTKSYKSSNTAVATVTSAGKVTAKKVGTVKITAMSAATSNYNAASKTVTIKVVPAATTAITAANQAAGIKLTWKKVTGAAGYKVYRGSTLIKTITNGSTVTFTDTKANTNGTKYTFKIIPTASTGNGLARTLTTYRVARPAVSSVKNSAKKKMTVKWGKNATATGYQIQYSTSKTFASGNKTVNAAKAGTVSKVIGGLTKKKTYYVRIRTYKTVGKVNYWSAWSPAKSVNIKK